MMLANAFPLQASLVRTPDVPARWLRLDQQGRVRAIIIGG